MCKSAELIQAEAELANAQAKVEEITKRDNEAYAQAYKGYYNEEVSKERVIEKQSETEFEITYSHLPYFIMTLNFQPLIDKFKLKGDYVLAHWHAKPVGERHFAFFQMKDGISSYKVIPFDTMELSTLVKMQTLQINDGEARALPSAVLYFPNAEIIEENDKFKVCDQDLCSLEKSLNELKESKSNLIEK